MPNFNYLPHNKSDFPHINNVDTYKYDNDFDYGRFNYDQMSLQVCSVPWDMGEAHVGNRTISGIGNVVYFGSKEKRDAWFKAIPDSECYRFHTKFKELHRDGFIDVPVPYDMCAKHNYLVVHYEKAANANSPVMYEDDDGIRDWFWFIREVEFLANNTTRLHIMDDAFQTWIYDVNISGMILERGHAPMFETKTDEYLANPLENNTNLLTEDVNFGTISQVKNMDVLELNSGNMYACIATTANPTAAWGTKADGTWHTPASAYYMNNGNPSVYVFAVAVEKLNTLLTNIETYAPQFKQTIQGVFFASNKLLTLAGNFTFCNVTCYGVDATRKNLDFVSLAKSNFGYDAKYADLAKLYTSPYAQIEVTDETGNVDVVKIEDTDGTLSVSVALSLAYPFITIDAHLNGAGGNVSKNVTYKNITSHTFGVEGRWYDTLRTWNVPTFAVVLDAATEYDYSTHFDRVQKVVDYTTDKDNADANAQNLLDNADATNTLTDQNKTATNTAVETNTTNHNTAITNVNTYNNTKIDADANISTGLNNQITQAQIDLACSSGVSSTGATIGSGFVSTLGSALSMDVGGMATGMAQSLISAGTASAINVQSMTTDANIAGIMAAGNSAYAGEATRCNDNVLQATVIENTQIKNTAVTLNNTQATNSITATSAIASNNANTISANAQRTANAAQSAIYNDISQAALRNPFLFGSFANGESSANKPIALFANVVTQSKGAISAAGDEFLRYGYTLDRYWEFDGNWNIGRYFTYWKLRDFWVSNLNVPDFYMDRLRFFLFGGVTVWRNPDDIGRVSIYDNFAPEGV